MANCFKNVSTPGFVMLEAAGTFDHTEIFGSMSQFPYVDNMFVCLIKTSKVRFQLSRVWGEFQ
jgi:hypothetical protein